MEWPKPSLPRALRPQSPRVILGGVVFHQPLPIGHRRTKRCPREFSGFHIQSCLSPLCSSCPNSSWKSESVRPVIGVIFLFFSVGSAAFKLAGCWAHLLIDLCMNLWLALCMWNCFALKSYNRNQNPRKVTNKVAFSKPENVNFSYKEKSLNSLRIKYFSKDNTFQDIMYVKNNILQQVHQVGLCWIFLELIALKA